MLRALHGLQVPLLTVISRMRLLRRWNWPVIAKHFF
jgi:hypothetical protein